MPDGDSEGSWQIGPEGLVLQDAVVSFQRYRCPAERVICKAPASCGVLPVAPGPKGLLLAVPSGEAFWIGVLVGAGWQGELAISARLASDATIPLARFDRSGAFSIDGMPRSDGAFDALCRDTVMGFTVARGDETTRIDLASVEDFVAQTGNKPPSPLNPGAAYRGWRLP